MSIVKYKYYPITRASVGVEAFGEFRVIRVNDSGVPSPSRFETDKWKRFLSSVVFSMEDK